MRAEEDTLVALSQRLQQVEGDVRVLKQDHAILRDHIRQIDERTLRGERLMMEMQMEQRHMARTLDAIAQKLDIQPLATLTPLPFAKPKESSEG